ncbi:MAG TPA: trypsin-like peptidase domain-containing protein [Sphingobacteriaceae bacterium]
MKSFLFAAIFLFQASAAQPQTDKPGSFEEKQKKASQNTRADIPEQVSRTLSFRSSVKENLNGVVHIKYFAPLRYEISDFFRGLFNDGGLTPYTDDMQITGTASGVIISNDGYIVTNHHVVNETDSMIIILQDQRTYNAKIIGSDPDTDIALLKIDETNLPFIAFGSADSVEVGDPILIIGHPPELPFTVTAGIISAKARDINILTERSSIESFIQTDATAGYGNSGGALIDVSGKLIGITSAIATFEGDYAGYSFAIPVEIVKKVTNDLLFYGKARHGYLGVRISNMNAERAKMLKVDRTAGVIIDSVQLNSNAMKNGIQARDVITAINEYKIETVAQLLGITARYSPSESIKLTITRHNTEKIITVTLVSAKEIFNEANEVKDILRLLGIEVKDLLPEERKKLKLRGGVQIINLFKGEITGTTTMKKDFIITKINNKAVNNISELMMELIHKKGPVIAEGIYPGDEGIYYYEFEIKSIRFFR